MSKHGRVRWDKERGWHIDFRTVVYPGAERPRHVRISRAPQYGKFENEREAERCLNTIRDRALSRPLCAVLAEYTANASPETTVLHCWEHDFIPSKQLQRSRGEISPAGLRELERMPARGYLAFWEGVAVSEIQAAHLHRWRDWLGQSFTLKPPTVRNVFGAFRTFLGHLHTMGAIAEVPRFPVVRLPESDRTVPDPVSLTRILAAIPEELRGLWLARGLAGLRPSEARRLDVSNYESGLLRIRADQSKTKKARELLVAAVVPELDSWIRENRAGAAPWEPLFQNPHSWHRVKRWKATAERRVWLLALDAAGVEHIAPNRGGRHAFATHEIGAGTDPFAVQQWMGHSSLKTTQGYVSVTAVTLARRMRPASQQRPSPSRKGENLNEYAGRVVGDTRFEGATPPASAKGNREE